MVENESKMSARFVSSFSVMRYRRQIKPLFYLHSRKTLSSSKTCTKAIGPA